MPWEWASGSYCGGRWSRGHLASPSLSAQGVRVGEELLSVSAGQGAGEATGRKTCDASVEGTGTAERKFK